MKNGFKVNDIDTPTACYYLSRNLCALDKGCHEPPVLCISTSFRVLAAPESWLKHFFQPFFDLFCSFQSFF